MAISITQLQAWINAPGSTKIEHTYQQIKQALKNDPALKSKNFEIYLQGSYANSTNIKVDSDIDVVVELKSTFSYDTARLSEIEKTFFTLAYPTNATYLWSHFRQDVINALINYFGSGKIKLSNNCVNLIGDAALLNADIVPCIEHRDFSRFEAFTQGSYVQGIKFFRAADFKEIINYPKVHIKNGEDKNAEHRTNERYKNIVRVIKNIKRRMVEDYGFNSDLAPSYFVECAIYNVPDGHFNGNLQSSLEYALNHILRERDPDQFYTVSHQHLLFGPEPWQWNSDDASTFFVGAEEYYNNN